jgi:hypothetical protein
LSARATSNPGLEQNPAAQSTPAPAQGNPFVQTGTQEHSFHTQFAFDVNKQVGKLETCMEHVEERLGKVEDKLDKMQADIAALNTTMGIIKPIATSVGKGVWAVFILLAGTVLSVAGAWVIHKLF